jgi:hypothetical protein
MTPATTWIRYKGDGSTPSDAAVQNRGETGRYLADPKLVTAVNTALAVEQPLLVTGEPGTGKTMLAWSIASELGLGPVLEFHTRSDNQARDTLYDFDYLLRFYHAQIHDKRVTTPEFYVRWNALGVALRSPIRRLKSQFRKPIATRLSNWNILPRDHDRRVTSAVRSRRNISYSRRLAATGPPRRMQSASTIASSKAWHAPCPRFGVVG